MTYHLSKINYYGVISESNCDLENEGVMSFFEDKNPQTVAALGIAGMTALFLKDDKVVIVTDY